MSATFDLVVVGAGPAGMAAAATASELGLTVAVIDEQDAPGGSWTSNWQRERKSAAFAFFAGYSDFAPMKVNEFAAEKQPKIGRAHV